MRDTPAPLPPGDKRTLAYDREKSIRDQAIGDAAKTAIDKGQAT